MVSLTTIMVMTTIKVIVLSKIFQKNENVYIYTYFLIKFIIIIICGYLAYYVRFNSFSISAEYQLLTIVIGLIGVVIILKPGTQFFTIYSIFPLLFCVFFGSIAVLIKQLSKTEPDYLIIIYFTLTLICCGFVSMFFDFKLPALNDLFLLILIGIAGSTGNIFLTMSLRRASVSTVTPIKYLSLVFATVAGIYIFNEIPHLTTFVGATLIILSTLIIFKREQIKKVSPVITRQI